MSKEKYGIIWFEGKDNYMLVNHTGPVLITEDEARASSKISGVLKRQEDVDRAEEDLRYAISLSLLENLFGIDVTTT